WLGNVSERDLIESPITFEDQCFHVSRMCWLRALGVRRINPGAIHDGKQRLSASNHFRFPCSRTRRVINAHKRFRSPARNPSHVSAATGGTCWPWLQRTAST